MSTREILHSWKEISAYLGREIRTCRRWEEHLGLPIHRLEGSSKARVLAYKDELDWWLETRLHEHDPVNAAPAPSPPGPAAPRTFFGLPLPGSLAFLRRWHVVPIFAGLLVLGLLGWRSIIGERPSYIPGENRPTLAVLPFVNGTGHEGLDYLRESLADHIIRDLQRSAKHLTVFSFDAVTDAVRKIGLEPGTPLTPGDLASVSERIGADWFLVGYFSGDGGKIRIDYEVRGAKAPEVLKSGHLPGAEAELAVVEARVADGVRRAFGVPTSAGPAAYAACSVEATRFYETARAVERRYTVNGSPADLETIIGLFHESRKVDPGCPLAYLGLGDAYQHRFVYEGRDPAALRLMEENYRRAYDLAPQRAETHVGLAWVHFFKRDNDQAYACLKKALALDPQSLHVLTDAGAFLRSIGLLERSTEYFTQVIEAGGRTADVFFLRAYAYEQMGLFEAALADFDKMIELEPTEFRTRCHRARVLILMARVDAAAAELAVAEALAPGESYTGQVRALAAAARGDRRTALAALAPTGPEGPPVGGTYYRSRILAVLGLKDEALAAIERAIDKGFDEVYDDLYVFPFLNNTQDHFYDQLRGDPRFAEILRREERKYAEKLGKYGGL